MPSSNPSQQCMEDDMIHMFERTTARHVSMIVGPTTDLRVEFTDQIACRQVKPASSYSANAVQEGLHILLGRLYVASPLWRCELRRNPARVQRWQPLAWQRL